MASFCYLLPMITLTMYQVADTKYFTPMNSFMANIMVALIEVQGKTVIPRAYSNHYSWRREAPSSGTAVFRPLLDLQRYRVKVTITEGTVEQGVRVPPEVTLGLWRPVEYKGVLRAASSNTKGKERPRVQPLDKAKAGSLVKGVPPTIYKLWYIFISKNLN